MNNFPFIDIFILAMIAVFIINRLRNSLGKKTGNESDIAQKFSQKPSKYTESNPDKEINLINETISELKKENKNFFLLTHYSFIHSLVGAKSFNSSRVHDDVSIPLKNDKNFEDYKKKFRRLFAEKKINKIFIISPVNYKSIDGIFPQNCYISFKSDLSDFEDKFQIALSDSYERTKIVNNAYELAITNHSWENRVKDITDQIYKHDFN